MPEARTVFVLVHAPLVGPSTWRWVARALAPAEVVVPDLHAGPEASFDHFVERVAAAVPPGTHAVLVGHSGAGALLPFVAAAARVASVTLVFVDAGLPPPSGDSRQPHPAALAAGAEWDARPSFADRVEPDGMLPPWHEWWGEAGMRWLVPDGRRRAAVCHDVPRMPLAFWAEGALVPEGWASWPAGYVLLSETYRLWADAARGHGWPVAEVPGTHLELVNRPQDVAAAIVAVAEAAVPAQHF